VRNKDILANNPIMCQALSNFKINSSKLQLKAKKERERRVTFGEKRVSAHARKSERHDD
jgi:hypothetical protein